jgi:hypothetical protein
MVWAKYKSQRDMLREFTAINTCQQCYISTRANTEKTFVDFLADNWEMLMRQAFKRRKPVPVSADVDIEPSLPTGHSSEPESRRRRSAAAQ